MKISIGSDHAGFVLKEKICDYLNLKGYTIFNKGTFSLDSCDYPDYAYPVAEEVKNNISDFGILICYTGIGMSMCANKVHTIRAALVRSVENAVLTREHNNANVLCLSSKDTTYEEAILIIDAFLNTEFTYGRHERRVNKVMEIEHE